MSLDSLAGESVASAGQEFLELLCAEPDWVQAECDAMMAAEWPIPPAIQPAGSAGADQWPRRWAAAAEPDDPESGRRAGVTTGSVSALQRSPPARTDSRTVH